MQNKFSISNILILISLVFTLLSFKFQNLFIFGMNDFFLEKGEYYYYFLQFFTSNFIHGDIMHLLFNGLFIYIFGNMVEIMIGKKKFLSFFIFISLFNGILLSIFANHQNTVGISGFALALLTYYTLELKSKKNPEYKGGITAIIINIGIGFFPGISLYGHIFGVIGGIIFYYLNKNFFSKQEIGFIEKFKDFITENKVIRPENIKTKKTTTSHKILKF